MWDLFWYDIDHFVTIYVTHIMWELIRDDVDNTRWYWQYIRYRGKSCCYDINTWKTADIIFTIYTTYEKVFLLRYIFRLRYWRYMRILLLRYWHYMNMSILIRISSYDIDIIYMNRSLFTSIHVCKQKE